MELSGEITSVNPISTGTGVFALPKKTNKIRARTSNPSYPNHHTFFACSTAIA
jgi:hypothetical protein